MEEHVGLVSLEDWPANKKEQRRIAVLALWALARAPMPGLEQERENIWNQVAEIKETTVGAVSHIQQWDKTAKLRLLDLPWSISDFVHEGFHLKYGSHPIANRYDDSWNSPYGYSSRVNRAIGKHIANQYSEEEAILFEITADLDQQMIQFK